MAGHSLILNGTRLFLDYPDAHGAARVNGRTWRWSFHHYCGPLWLRRDGEPRKNQYPASPAVWAAFMRWHRHYQRNRSARQAQRPALKNDE